MCLRLRSDGRLALHSAQLRVIVCDKSSGVLLKGSQSLRRAMRKGQAERAAPLTRAWLHGGGRLELLACNACSGEQSGAAMRQRPATVGDVGVNTPGCVAPLTGARCLGAQLKLLACHISGGEQSGTVYANGQPIVEAEFKNQLAVVWQSDVLLPTATVRRAGLAALGWAPACMPGRAVVLLEGGRSMRIKAVCMRSSARLPACWAVLP